MLMDCKYNQIEIIDTYRRLLCKSGCNGKAERALLRQVACLLAAAFFASLFSNAHLPCLVICALRGSVNMGQH